MSDERLRRDELVSTYLDGEATPAEIAEVESDDALLARVEQLRAARDAVAEPVRPLTAQRREQLISAALAVSDAEAEARREARVVPLHKPQRMLLAVAAAAVVLAAVVSAGLIAGRGGDDADEMATGAPSIAAADAPADMAEEAVEEESMAEMDMATADEAMAAEEPMAEEMEMAAATTTHAPAATQAPAAEEDAAEAEITTAADSDEDADAAAPEAEEKRLRTETTDSAEPEAGGPAEQVVDLGALESLDSLFESIGASWSAALEDGRMADPGPCSASVHERTLELSTETLRSFAATVGIEDPVSIDARFARRADGTSFIVYAAPPRCEIEIHELTGS